MFVIEKFTQDYHARVKAWEVARDKWVNGGGEYSYRNKREYEENHPRPGHWVKIVLQGAIIALMVVVVVGGLVATAVHHHNEDKKHPKPPTAQVVKATSGKKCQDYYVGDTGYIDFGDYEGAHVKIVGGCGSSDDYQVITLEDQTLFGKGSKHESMDDKFIKAGLTFSVNSSSNIVVTGHEKD